MTVAPSMGDPESAVSRTNWMKRLVAVLGIAMLSTACSVVGVRSGWEQPPYQVVERLAEDLEIRRYGPRLAAEAVVQDRDGRRARSTAFRLLFRYIAGTNEPGDKIAMTTPVETASYDDRQDAENAADAPVETSEAADTERMRFFLPAELTAETAPPPTDRRVRVVTVPAQTLAVLRFTGSTGPMAVAAKRAQLTQALAGTPWHVQGRAIAYFYDPPWTLPFLRRNEVAIAVTR